MSREDEFMTAPIDERGYMQFPRRRMTREQMIDEAVRRVVERTGMAATAIEWQLAAMYGYGWVKSIRAEFRRIIEAEARAQSGGAR